MFSRVCIYFLAFVLLGVHCLGTAGTTQATSTLTCESNVCSGCSTTSCSPNSCAAVSNADLSMPTETIDFPTAIEGATCNSACTASTAPICQSLSSVFKGSGIKAAYCTDQFLVIHTTGYPDHSNWLAGVPRPPGGDGDYATAGVVRTMREQYQTYKIPLTVAASANPSTQAMNSKLANANLPFAGAVGVTVSGVPIYPALDNADKLAWAMCESDQCNAHAGKGFDYHYHGDPFGPNCMYSSSMYPSGHPMIIGFGMDGYVIFGRYTDASTQPSSSTPLDDCGGHSHGSYGYHYHAHVETGRTAPSGAAMSGTFTAYWNAPALCFKGNIQAIPNFWDSDNRQINYDNTFSSPKNTIASRNDYCFLRPCCSTASAGIYSAAGITVHTAAGGAGQTTACASSMTGTSAASDGSLGSAQTTWLGSYPSSPSPSPSPSPAPTPAGDCTVPTSSATSAFTANSQSYMCSAKSITTPSSYSIGSLSASSTSGFGCCQTDDAGTATCTCSNLGSGLTIQCFSYASSGKVSGSCGSCTTSLSDGDCTADLPATVGASCIGKASCELTMTATSAASATVSATTLNFFTNTGTSKTTNTCSAGNVKHKFLVYCAAPTPLPTPSPSPPTPTPTPPTPTPPSTITLTAQFSNLASATDYTGVTKATYENGVGRNLGIVDSSTNSFLSGNSVTSSVSRRAVNVNFIATVAPAQAQAASAAAARATSSSLVTSISAAKSANPAATSVSVPTQTQVTVVSSGSDSDNTAVIVGAAVGGAVGLIIIAGLIYYFFCRSSQSPNEQSYKPSAAGSGPSPFAYQPPAKSGRDCC